ncbi:hypothetical protein BRE01_12560 [Brevibacillus reuszeri]|uniref:Uncharacterized protein n=1 Tax=Brevibacillus reuszeri TaxID=54915 RepID=A0A0K9YT61_9BACL|nr:hypothetical protein [Brevibacillus reuszeri]KNB71871.1 hypothetical protein ADS79_24315 [Brevibacillus reuszeri]MED1855295.1 hypothetical protein [Brevibacillus reuszeri]GED67554.1 hypothetical protein BRE01_12560 [Brevibacillus reuszeri]
MKAGTEKTYVLSVSLDGKSGSLKVNDVESVAFDFSANGLANAIAAVKAANSSNIVAALEAPVLGLKAIDSTLAAEYVTEIGKSFVSSRELIQAAVDRVNAAAGTAIGEKIAAVKSANGPVALLDALEKLGVQRVIGLAHDGGNAVIEGTPSLAAKYHTAIASQTIATKTDVQAIIDTVNGAEVTKLVVAAEAAVTTDSVTAAASLLAAYDNGIADDKVEVDLGKRLDVVTALVAVNAAPDAAGLLTAIKSADLALVEVVDANADAYKAQVDAQAEGFKFATVAQLQSFVKQVNATVNTSAIDAVNKAVDAPALLTALKSSVLGLKKVADANEAAYFAALTGKTFTTVTEIQAFVDGVNKAQSEAALVAAINTATKSNIEEAVTSFVATFANDAYINVGSKKRAEVISTFWVNHGEGRSEAFTSAAEVSAALTAAVSEYEGYINGINSAKNITEMRAAFDVFIDDLEAAYGDEVTTKVEELQNTSVYANGSFTIEAATSIFEALQVKRSDADTTNDDFATVAEALATLSK